MKQLVFVLGGAVVGGFLGHLAFLWLANQGFYGLILPGALLGLGASLGQPRSVWPAIVCGVLATALGVFSEWRFAPFAKDPSLEFFLQHLHHLKPLTLLMIAAGGLIGFWVPFRNQAETGTNDPAAAERA